MTHKRTGRWGWLPVAALLLGGWILVNRKRNYPPLPPAVAAPRKTVTLAGIDTSYYVADQNAGRPLVLIHSINAAPSAYELKPLFEHYQGERPVYALELPGFGFSDRSSRRYSPQLFTETIIAFLRDVVQQPADVIALSLGSEFAAMAALDAPELVTSLTVISPTGFNKIDVADAIPGQFIHGLLTLPVLSQGLFDLLTRRKTVAYYLGKNFVGEPPEAFIDYAYTTAHQMDARHAPLYFLSGQLFTGGVLNKVYAKLTVPTLVIYDEDPNVNFAKLTDFLKDNSTWQGEKIVPTLGLPHWEKLEETTAALSRFWQSI